MDQIVLDKKECTYTYFADPMYVFMDAEYNQFEVEAENMGDAINYLEDSMPWKWCSTTARHLGRTADQTLVREITTEPAVKGDTYGQGHEARQDRHRRSRSRFRCSSIAATRSRSTRARTSTRKRADPSRVS
jgi:hypothetical protein